MRRTTLNGGLAIARMSSTRHSDGLRLIPSLTGHWFDWGTPLKLAKVGDHAAAPHQNGVASRHMRCITTASLRATAIFAFFRLLRCAILIPHDLIEVHWRDRVNITCAAVKRAVRVNPSPERLMRPRTSVSPDWYCRGVKPRCAPTSLEAEPGWIIDRRLEC